MNYAIIAITVWVVVVLAIAWAIICVDPEWFRKMNRKKIFIILMLMFVLAILIGILMYFLFFTEIGFNIGLNIVLIVVFVGNMIFLFNSIK